jgi:deoxyhypusine synthase
VPYPKYRPLNKKNLKTVSIKDRQSLVNLSDFPKPYLAGADFNSFINSLPPFLAAKDLRQFTGLLGEARKKNKPIIWGLGAHVVKLGLSPLIIDLMQRGWISAIAANGALMIHDFEIALAGKTSEKVADNLLQGNYGNTEETGLFLNLALKEGMTKNMGAGEAVGYYLIQAKLPNLEHSILFNAYKLNIPAC